MSDAVVAAANRVLDAWHLDGQGRTEDDANKESLTDALRALEQAVSEEQANGHD